MENRQCVLSPTPPVAREPETSPARYLNLRNLHALLDERSYSKQQEVILERDTCKFPSCPLRLRI